MRKALVRWAGESNWHLTESINHGTTACNLRIPLKEMAPEYAEIEISEIKSFKGTCKKCFHEICIEHQNQDLWAIYYAHIAEKHR
ncbi:MAG: hypothetical protein WA049_08800 [Ferribacterium limneticum]